LQRIEPDPDAYRNEGAEAAMDVGTERDPLIGNFGVFKLSRCFRCWI
jgi:hypothetical protein